MSANTGAIPESDLVGRAAQARALQAYVSQSREAQEEKWILDSLPMVRHIVQKICSQFSRTVDWDELMSAGTLGLVKAAKAYDPSRDAEFKTYAYIRIRGAVIDEIRGRSFVPPTVHNQIRKIKDTYRRFQSEVGRPPDDDELAAQMEMSVEDLYQTLEKARQQHFMCIHGLSEDESVLNSLSPVDNAPSPSSQAERLELMERLARAILELPKRDRHILMLYYERDLTMKEVAAVLNVTESRVSQLHASALLKLSMKLAPAGVGSE